MPRASRPYHHGDLRRALLRVALQILRTEGATGLTLRAVARRANVSHQAPYHHFADRAALVAAVAQEGFERLAADLARAREAVGGDPVAQLQESGVGYVLFAVRHPEHFRVMFGPELAERTAHPDLDRAARSVFDALLAPARGLLPAPVSGTGTVGATLWSAVHGLAMLLIDGQLPGPPSGGATAREASARRFALGVTEQLWVGLQGKTRCSSR